MFADGDDGNDPAPSLPAEGDSCQNNYFCGDELRCMDLNDYPDYPEEVTDYCRTCVAPSLDGEDCAAAATYCDTSDPNDPLYCSALTGDCSYRLGAGESCVEHSVPCDADSWCDSDTDGSGLCVTRLAEGAPCEDYDQRCPLEMHCSMDRMVCTAPEPEGAACRRDSHCTTEFCNQNLGDPSVSGGLCDTAGFEGDPCSDNNDCRYPGDCVQEVGMCIVERHDGEPCVRDFQCYADFCDPLTDLCGRRQPGEPCAEDRECSNYSCDPTTLRCGLPDGQPCNDDDDCQSNSCDSYYTDTCLPSQALGESCGRDEECASGRCYGGICVVYCYSDEQCAVGEYCDWNNDVCRPPGEDGSSCDWDEHCLSGWCSPNDVCGTKPEIGDPCSGYGSCYPRGYCGPDGVCVAKAGPYQPCSGYDGCLDPYICLDGRCRPIPLTCAPAQPGAMCTFLMVCAEGAYCDQMDEFTCKPRKGEGQDCMRGEECREGMICSGTCTRAPQVGEACLSGSLCAAGLWCDYMADPQVCRQKLGEGETCDRDEHCISDYCSDVCQPSWDTPSCVMP